MRFISVRALSGSLLFCWLTLVSGFVSAQGENTVSINFSNADIPTVIQAIGKATNKNFVIDPRVRGTVNIVTPRPVDKDMAYAVLLSALRLQGYVVLESKGVSRVVPEVDGKVHAGPVLNDRVGGGEQLVTRVFSLKNESASQMMTVLRPLISPNNAITAYPGNNSLIVTDYADNVARLERIVESIDVPQGDVVAIPVENGSAVDLAVTLNRLLNDGNAVAGTGSTTEPTQRVGVVADSHSNTLLVRSNNLGKLATVQRLVQQLDRKNGASGNIHLVYLKNAQAVKMAQTLRAVLSGDNSQRSVSDGFASSGTMSGASTSLSGAGNSSVAGGVPSAGLSANSVSGGGMVQADPLNNALIITAPESIYANLRHVIEQLDRRAVQVYVEALIVEINSERAAEFGIQWQSTNSPTSGGGGTFLGGTNFSSGGNNIVSLASNPLSAGNGLNFIIGKGLLSIPDGRGGSISVLNLGMLARFLESDNKTNILSTPTLVTLDNEEAKIVVGQNLPFVTGQYTNTGGGTTVNNPFQTIERRDVGLTLKIKPQISEGGTIRMQIFQEASSVIESSFASANGPITNKRSLESSVLVDDGEIIALGGLMQDAYSGGVQKVPLLGDLPLIGQAFRYDTRKRSKTNLVIFLRPKILRDKSSYAGITSDRYDYVIGLQKELADPRALLRNEPEPPQLPMRLRMIDSVSMDPVQGDNPVLQSQP